MRPIRTFATAAALSLLAAGCMHNRAETSSAGDIAIDSLSASRTGLLRVANNYSAEVRVYAINGGQKNYIAKAMPGETRTFVLDPNLFPANAISFEAGSFTERPISSLASCPRNTNTFLFTFTTRSPQGNSSVAPG